MPSPNTNKKSIPRAKKALTDLSIKALQPRADGKEMRTFDPHPDYPGLYVATSSTGRKTFRLKYHYGGREKLLTLGTYPATSLALAREKAMKAREHLARGIDPATIKKEEQTPDTFRHWAELWYAKMAPTWSEVYCEDVRRNKLDLHVLPVIGEKLLPDLAKRDYEAVLNLLKAATKLETAKKVRGIMGQVVDFFINETEREITNWPFRLRKDFSVSKRDRKHRAALVLPGEIGLLMANIEAYREINLQTYLALRFSALTFQRPGEIRKAEWAEIDWKEKLWLIPANKMKARREHSVPLSKQALAVLEELKPMTGNGRYLFPSTRSKASPMSEATVLAAIRRLGYDKTQMTAHGFRGMASTTLNEMGFNKDWVEMQLSHVEENDVRGAYNFAQYLPQRRDMMQQWADHLYKLEMQARLYAHNERRQDKI